MNLQQIKNEVQKRADARMPEILASIIQKQLDILDDIPPEFSSYDEYVDWALGKYVEAKILAHRIKKAIDGGCGASMAPWTYRNDDDLHRDLVYAESRVKLCQERYYKAIGSKKANGVQISIAKTMEPFENSEAPDWFEKT